MRRAICLLVAVLAAAVALPAEAATPTGDVVVIAMRSASGTVSLPAAVTLDFDHMHGETSSKYAVLAAYQRIEEPSAFWVKDGTSNQGYAFASSLGRGRSVVRVLTSKPFTMFIPAKGIRGRVVVRLNTPIPGAVTKEDDAAFGLDAASNELPFTSDRTSVVVHGYDMWSPYAVGHVERFCIGPAGPTCDDGVVTLDNTGVVLGVGHLRTELYDNPGAHLAKLTIVGTGITGPVTHYVMVLPLV